MPKPASPPKPDQPSCRPLLIGSAIWEELDSYDKDLKSKFIRAFRFMSRDIGHPSLRLELVKSGAGSFYRARIDDAHRVHFEVWSDYYLILAIGAHRLDGIG